MITAWHIFSFSVFCIFYRHREYVFFLEFSYNVNVVWYLQSFSFQCFALARLKSSQPISNCLNQAIICYYLKIYFLQLIKNYRAVQILDICSWVFLVILKRTHCYVGQNSSYTFFELRLFLNTKFTITTDKNCIKYLEN